MSSRKKQTMAEFMVEQEKARCPLCRLPHDIRMQLQDRDRRVVPLPMALKWVKAQTGKAVTDGEYRKHYQRRHGWDGV